jgi:U32 family peptidase
MTVELLAPAGSMECLETAFYFGADAAYIGGNSFGLRAYSPNFTNEELRMAVRLAHDNRKKIYITANSVIGSSQMNELTEYLFFLADTGVDAVIASDPAVVKIIRDHNIALNIHLSTQANTCNYMSAAFWHEAGVRRIVLSRELSLDDIRTISNNKPKDLELEVFVHGAMCVAYSGRCLLSHALTGRSANKGECTQPCRWEYHLHEKGHDGQYFPISEDVNGTYVLNSKDLMMIEYIPELMEAGITSFKIEGRMKSPYYVASTVNAYRRAMDAFVRDGGRYAFDPSLKEELVKSATRQFSTGFFFGRPQQDIAKEEGTRCYSFVAMVREDAADGQVLLEQRNKFLQGDTLEVLSPHLSNASIVVEKITNMDGEEQDSAPHPQQIIRIPCSLPCKAGDILRKII